MFYPLLRLSCTLCASAVVSGGHKSVNFWLEEKLLTDTLLTWWQQLGSHSHTLLLTILEEKETSHTHTYITNMVTAQLGSNNDVAGEAGEKVYLCQISSKSYALLQTILEDHLEEKCVKFPPSHMPPVPVGLGNKIRCFLQMWTFGNLPDCYIAYLS